MKDKNKIIFLDIDGVLNSRKSMEFCKEPDPGKKSIQMYMPHPIHLDNLQNIIWSTGAKVVISSSWRIGCTSVRMWNTLFVALGYVDIDVIGVTPSLNGSGDTRGDEIQAWLDKNKEMSMISYMSTHCKPVESFVILDDDSDMKHLIDRLVQMDGMVGLTEEKANEAIRMLNNV